MGASLGCGSGSLSRPVLRLGGGPAAHILQGESSRGPPRRTAQTPASVSRRRSPRSEHTEAGLFLPADLPEVTLTGILLQHGPHAALLAVSWEAGCLPGELSLLSRPPWTPSPRQLPACRLPNPGPKDTNMAAPAERSAPGGVCILSWEQSIHGPERASTILKTMLK